MYYSGMHYRRLQPADAEVFQKLRVSGLAESPNAFISTPAEDLRLPMATVEERLRVDRDSAVFGAWRDANLLGIAAIRREPKARLQHKASLWGVYVAPDIRGMGAGRELVRLCLAFAREMGVRQVNLGVNESNAAALRLYESLGFRTFGREECFMCVDGQWQHELHMVCVLGEE